MFKVNDDNQNTVHEKLIFRMESDQSSCTAKKKYHKKTALFNQRSLDKKKTWIRFLLTS